MQFSETETQTKGIKETPQHNRKCSLGQGSDRVDSGLPSPVYLVKFERESSVSYLNEYSIRPIQSIHDNSYENIIRFLLYNVANEVRSAARSISLGAQTFVDTNKQQNMHEVTLQFLR